MAWRLITTVATAAMLIASSASAEQYPTGPIKLILPFAAGSGSDTSGRIIVDQVRKDTGAVFIVDNRAGAGGIIGASAAARSPADGYTITTTTTSSHSLAPSISKSTNYDPIKDFAHIALLTQVPFVLIVPANSKYNTVTDLVADAKANKGKLRYAYASNANQIMAAAFQTKAGIESVAVPYKSSSDALIDLSGNRTDYMMIDAAAATGMVRDGKMKALLVLSDTRSKLMPDVPSLKESGLPTIELIGWVGLGAPAGIPEDARQWLAKSFRAALANPETIAKLAAISVEPLPPLDPDKFVADQLRSWAETAKAVGIEPQ